MSENSQWAKNQLTFWTGKIGIFYLAIFVG